MEKDLECLQKEMTVVKDLAEATQKDSQSMCGRVAACESCIKELTKQLQTDALGKLFIIIIIIFISQLNIK